MMIKVGQKLISELVEINSFLVISEALNFKVFSGEHAPGPLYTDSCLQRLLSSCYMQASPIKRQYALCPNSKS